MKFDPEIHHRRSIRLKGYDYTLPGAYFLTICTYHREEIFGEVTEGEMRLNPLGEIVQAEWIRSAKIRKEIRLIEDEFVVMPNHVHGIVWIVENESVGADGVRPGEQPSTTKNESHDKGARSGGTRRVPLRMAPRSLSSFIAGFKAAVTSRAGQELNAANIWQRNYYERIIRNENELRNFWDYIDINPMRWQDDPLHPSAPPDPFDQVTP